MKLQIKKCEYCSKELMNNDGYNDLVLFCDDTCLLEYCKEYANDSDSYEKEPIDRNDLD